MSLQNQANTNYRVGISGQEQIRDIKNKYMSQRRFVFGNNVIQYALATWLSPIFALGSRMPISQQLIPELKKDDKTEQNFYKFKQMFNRYKEENQFGFSGKVLLKTICNFYKEVLFSLIVFCVVIAAIKISIPIFSYKIVNYIQQKQRPFWSNFKYFFIQSSLFFLQSMGLQMFYFFKNIKGINIANNLSMMIFDKVLRYPLLSSKKFDKSQITNLFQIDSNRFKNILLFMQNMIQAVLETIASIVIIYFYIGFSGFLIGLALIILYVTVNLTVSNFLISQNEKLMQCKDKTIKIVQQIIDSIKFIKINALENEFINKVKQRRDSQLKVKLKIGLLNFLSIFISSINCPIIIFCIFIVYRWLGNQIQVGKIILVIMIFTNLQIMLRGTPRFLSYLTQTFISLQRIQKFLLAQEIDESVIEILSYEYSQNSIQIINGNFHWEKILIKQQINPKNDLKQQQLSKIENQNIENEISNKLQNVDHQLRYVKLFHNLNLRFPSKELTMIIGDLGSNKSSLIYSILNQMTAEPNSKVKVFGSIACCTQKPWIMTGTIKDNILFYEECNQKRFSQSIYYSCLQQDLKNFPSGVYTQIGQKGANLSGGQKARVSLARALYSNRDIYMFDDILSALDVKVANFLMNHTIGHYLVGKTIIMTTHSKKHIDKADNLVIFDKQGIQYKEGKECKQYQQILKRVQLSRSLDSPKKLIKKKSSNQAQSNFVSQFQQSKEGYIKIQPIKAQGEDEKEQKKLIQLLIMPEQQKEGQTKLEVYLEFLSLNGGKIFLGSIILGMSLWAAFSMFSNLAILRWEQNKEGQLIYLYIYIGFALQSSIFLGICCLIFVLAERRCSSSIHRTIIKKLVKGDYIQFFNRVPKGRILNRLSNDIDSIDNISTYFLLQIVICLFSILAGFYIGIYVSSPLALIPIVIMGLITFLIYNYYIKSQRSLVRLTKIAVSPVLSGLTQLMNGIDTVRIFNKEKQFLKNQLHKIDISKAIQLTTFSMQYWFLIRSSSVDLIFSFSILAYCIFREVQNQNQIGLFLIYSITFIEEINNLFFFFASIAREMISVERLIQLTDLKPEPGYKQVQNQNQPLIQYQLEKHGEQAIKFIEYSVQYRKSLPFALKNLNFTIQKGDKVGIVGRTGAGKSTLFNCLLRIVEPSQGYLMIKNKEIRQYDVRHLRSIFTMVEQDPTLIQGTFRQNLDPTLLQSDEKIYQVIRKCKIQKLVEQKGGIDSIISNRDTSAGQRQLICIGRALLRKSQIVLIDEATASMDATNDQLVQEIISTVFQDKTVLTIAHRLQTLKNCKKILVLNEGKVVEWGNVDQMLKNKTSIYRQMLELHDKSYLI